MGDGSRSLVRAAARARGGRRGSCERALSRGLHGEAGQRGLRAPRLPEESHARDRDAEARTRSDQSAPAMGPAPRARRRGGAMKIIKSSGNVFADLGLPGAEERLLKARLAAEIARTIARRKLTQAAAADLMGIDQPKVSHLLHGRLAGFSTERLLTWLTALGQDVEIVVRRPSRRRAGRLRVLAGSRR